MNSTLSVPTAVHETSIDPSPQNPTISSTSSYASNGGIESSSTSLGPSQFLSLYYESFHAAHPCALPFQFLKNLLTQARVQPLVQVMCYIGSIFDKARSSQVSEFWAQRAEDSVAEIRSQIRPLSPFDVQALLLYSIAVYWCNETESGLELLDEAIRLAVALGMNKREFAQSSGEGMPVLEESWRRTWWVIYITDAHIAGILPTYDGSPRHVANHDRIYTYLSVPNE